MSAAIHMVAFGVLEYPAFKRGKETDESMQKRAEIHVLVYHAFKERNWILSKAWSNKRRPMQAVFILHGPQGTTSGMAVREKIAEGTLQEVCLAAVEHDRVWSELPE